MERSFGGCFSPCHVCLQRARPYCPADGHHFDAPVVSCKASAERPAVCPAADAGSPGVGAGPTTDGGKRVATTAPSSGHHHETHHAPKPSAPPQPINTQQTTTAALTSQSTPAEVLRRQPSEASELYHLAAAAAPGKIIVDGLAACSVVDRGCEPFFFSTAGLGLCVSF
ncbi:uncharacterized protein LOC119455986 [Dermacentor silvarum]|uniref:uncharacterized protein LOC119455986 n=1 Tax=Dermacentor silvarum TaxID=543639 RepID=UPI00189BEEC6|nr:uncharacterized protein LOC119455986 [Dermacentor silvarum]